MIENHTDQELWFMAEEASAYGTDVSAEEINGKTIYDQDGIKMVAVFTDSSSKSFTRIF